MDAPVDLLALLRSARRSASGRNKVVLALYGLLCLVPLCLLVVAAGRRADGSVSIPYTRYWKLETGKQP